MVHKSYTAIDWSVNRNSYLQLGKKILYCCEVNILCCSLPYCKPSCDYSTCGRMNREFYLVLQNSSMITSCMHNLFNKIFRLSPRTKHLLLNWIGRLIAANSGRVPCARTLGVVMNKPAMVQRGTTIIFIWSFCQCVIVAGTRCFMSSGGYLSNFKCSIKQITLKRVYGIQYQYKQTARFHNSILEI